MVRLTDPEGRPLVNSFGDTFEGGVEFPFSIPTLSVKFQKLAGGFVPQTWQKAYVGTVNRSAYLGWGPGQVLCRAINVTKNVNKGRTYYDIDFELAFEAWSVKMAVFASDYEVEGEEVVLKNSFRDLTVGWHKVLADVGYRYRDDSLGNTATPVLEKTVAFKDADGNPFVGFLDGFGVHTQCTLHLVRRLILAVLMLQHYLGLLPIMNIRLVTSLLKYQPLLVKKEVD